VIENRGKRREIMDHKPVSVAVVGTGKWGMAMGAVLRNCESVKVVTCCNRSQSKAKAFSETYGCPHEAYGDILQREDVEAVILTTPNSVHADHTTLAAEHGKHVLVEKPIANTVADARRMIDACKTNGVVLSVAHNQRRLAGYRKLKTLLEKAALGKVVSVEANFSHGGGFKLTPDFWRWHEAECPGGPMMTMGVHMADTLQFLLGPVTSVGARFKRLCLHTEIMDTGTAGLEFESGVVGNLMCSYVTPWNYFLHLYGTEANAYFDIDLSGGAPPGTDKYGDIWNLADSRSRLQLRRKGEDHLTELELKSGGILTEEIEEFVQCVRESKSPETGGEEGLRALAVILAAVGSAHTGHPALVSDILCP
jgi:UDP-N-acetylglucosamine 3-dehydrogenase